MSRTSPRAYYRCDARHAYGQHLARFGGIRPRPTPQPAPEPAPMPRYWWNDPGRVTTR